jgi:hypothetical protein
VSASSRRRSVARIGRRLGLVSLPSLGFDCEGFETLQAGAVSNIVGGTIDGSEIILFDLEGRTGGAVRSRAVRTELSDAATVGVVIHRRDVGSASVRLDPRVRTWLARHATFETLELRGPYAVVLGPRQHPSEWPAIAYWLVAWERHAARDA